MSDRRIAGRKLRIGMLGLYGMPMAKLHFTGFETGFGEIAPRLVEAGHEIVIYCRRGSYPPEMRLPTYKGVRLIYVPSPGERTFRVSSRRSSRSFTHWRLAATMSCSL